MGIELNPRLGSRFDLKLFHNERIGIELWSLLNISYACKQYELYGYVTNSMVRAHSFSVVWLFGWLVGWWTNVIFSPPIPSRSP